MNSSARSSGFGQALQFITSIKLQELEKQRLAYQNHAKILKTVQSSDKDLVTKVELLREAVKSWTGSGALNENDDLGGKLNLFDLDLWLPQAKKDPSFNPDILKNWIDAMETHINHNLMRFDCAKLFGNLFNEWLASGDSSTNVDTLSPELDDAASVAPSEFVDVGRQEKYEQLDRLQSIIFEEPSIDTDRLIAYLTDLFAGDEGEKVLKKIRKDIKEYGKSLRRKKILDADVTDTIRGLLASGLMDEEKRATLGEFLNNPTVITEVASVMNMRLASLDTWSWPAEGLVVEMRRHLNGKYR
jgi:hypothetical protein